MAAGLYAIRGVEMEHEWTGPVTRGKHGKVGWNAWYQTINLHIYLYIYNW